MENAIRAIIIAILTLLIVYFCTRFKKKKEAEMNAEFNSMTEQGDLEGLSHFYKKQLYWWVPLTVCFLSIFGAGLLQGFPVSRLLIYFIGFAISAYRVFLLCKNLFEVKKKKKL